MIAAGDPYRLLGLSRAAGPHEVRRAFRRLVLEHHPDRNPSDPRAVERFKMVVEAYRRIARQAERSRAARRVIFDPPGEWCWGQPGGLRRYRGGAAHLPVRWRRAASGFVVTHGKSIPLLASMILSLLITAAGLLSEGRLAPGSVPTGRRAPAAQVCSLLK